MNLSKFFKTGNQAPAQRREKQATEPEPTMKPTPYESPSQTDFFYGSSSDLRKKAPKK